jgi:hypothetical protein
MDLAKLMELIGIYVNDRRLHEIMKMYHADENGTIGFEGFLKFLKSHHGESVKRIKDLTEVPILVDASAKPGRPKMSFRPPTIGILHMTTVDGFIEKKCSRVMSAAGKNYILDAMKDCGSNTIALCRGAIHNGIKLRLGAIMS